MSNHGSRQNVDSRTLISAINVSLFHHTCFRIPASLVSVSVILASADGSLGRVSKRRQRTISKIKTIISAILALPPLPYSFHLPCSPRWHLQSSSRPATTLCFAHYLVVVTICLFIRLPSAANRLRMGAQGYYLSSFWLARRCLVCSWILDFNDALLLYSLTRTSSSPTPPPLIFELYLCKLPLPCLPASLVYQVFDSPHRHILQFCYYRLHFVPLVFLLSALPTFSESGYWRSVDS